MLLKEKVAIVTGAGSGIGAATAKKLAAEGAKVVVADVADDGGRRVVDEIVETGGIATFQHADIANESEVDALVARAVDEYGTLDLAVNNAGFSHPPMRLHEVSTETWDALMSVNLRGTWLCMRAELRHLLEHGGGAIVNMASGAGLKAAATQGVYSASKHGIVGLTRTAAIEYVTDGIRINAVAPGVVATPGIMSLPADVQAAFAALMPSGRMAEPAEIADVVAWLLSDRSTYVSGDTIEVDLAYLQK
ncbi:MULTISPECIES: SDR family NAD(P)-dependent oxidoreductase [Nocardia]|uniref:SDR family NAD(P)-dependent oxidoreductase n=1 Tax=Nocardia TaxID=1817 RepID=UPI000D687FEE|nr:MULTISPECIES: SDR family NAD(P)-dependent oxidoreductase [Nocardia]